MIDLGEFGGYVPKNSSARRKSDVKNQQPEVFQSSEHRFSSDELDEDQLNYHNFGNRDDPSDNNPSLKSNPDYTTIIAEDGWINVQMLKYNLKELNLLNVCKFEINGKAAVEAV